MNIALPFIEVFENPFIKACVKYLIFLKKLGKLLNCSANYFPPIYQIKTYLS